MIKVIKKSLAVAALATMAFSFGSSASAQVDTPKQETPKVVAKSDGVGLYANDPGGI
ncbi:hypothetical protein [Priestia flexa]|uniref:hypothetical protein n=1 Tax=Priestia flexa TaxID=86664 RepID=UPI00248FAEF0|nr:hypothetical protein [Priestia flexa]